MLRHRHWLLPAILAILALFALLVLLVLQGLDGQDIFAIGMPFFQSQASSLAPDETESSGGLWGSTPIVFAFGTSVPPSVSDSRPPSYPAPWALTAVDHFYFMRPIQSHDLNWTHPGYRYGNTLFHTFTIHSGVDFAAAKGTPVLAAGDGEVIFLGYGLARGNTDPEDPYGLAIVLRHNFGYAGQQLYTVYAHLDSAAVGLGQPVQMGDMLGGVGETGRATGPHLHFEVRLGSNTYFSTRNPELWMTLPEGYGVLAGRILDNYGHYLSERKVRIQSLDSEAAWEVWTYARGVVHPDDTYEENFAISDLPAGRYLVEVNFYWQLYSTEVTVLPGRTNMITFRGASGFNPQAELAPEG
jgi:murein DD-endopeptidase MepM/ murein hydrolase activator NlpD